MAPNRMFLQLTDKTKKKKKCVFYEAVDEHARRRLMKSSRLLVVYRKMQRLANDSLCALMDKQLLTESWIPLYHRRGTLGVAVLFSILCGIPMNKIPHCSITVISNPTVCDVCALNLQ